MSMLIRALFILLSILQTLAFAQSNDCQNLSTVTLGAFPIEAMPDAKITTTFNLHYWTLKTINPNLSSLVLIPGGPGQSYQKLEWVDIENVNIIFFDPRGMGCSIPTQNELINNPDFYSAKLIAHDLEQLRKHLKISKWSVYGHSYGTIPATIYASFYPQSTENLLLEGTVLKGGKDFWYSQARHDLIYKVLQNISPDLQAKALSSSNSNLHSFWFSQGLLDSLPQGFDKEILEKRLSQNYSQEQKHPFIPKMAEPEDLLPYFSRNAHLILSCKELSADQYSPKRLFYFDGKDFQFLQKPTYAEFCKEWPIKPDVYDAKNYPLSIPTYYFQGEYDYLTPQAEALEHYLNNQSKEKHFFTLKNGGHNPLSLSLNEFNKKTPLSLVYQKVISDIVTKKFNPNDFIESSKSLKQNWKKE